MDECPSCGTEYADHVGLIGTCAEVQRLRAENEKLRDEVERLTKEDTFHKEFTVARVKVLAKALDCAEGLPNDVTIYGCVGTILGMFRHRVDILKADIATAHQRGRVEGIEEAAKVAETAFATEILVIRATGYDIASKIRSIATAE